MTDAIKRAAEALVQYETSGMCLPGKKCQMCDCGVQNMDRAQLAEDLERNQDRARHALTAALSDRNGVATNILSTILRSKEDPNSGRLALEIRDALVAHLIGGEGETPRAVVDTHYCDNCLGFDPASCATREGR